MSRRKLPASLRKRFPARVSTFLKLKIIVLAVVSILAITTGASYAIFKTVSRDLPQITSLKNYKPPLGTQIFSEDDHLIGRLKVDKGIFVPLAHIPDGIKKAVVAVEDARFYEHNGLDYQGILRAVLKDMLSVSLKEGGSTITQQLAKVLFLSPEKNLSRKLKEAVLAKKIEDQLTKDEILELYLNKVYFGHGAYGVEMAARTYFGKHVGDLTLGECALVAGLIRSPANYSPYNSMEQARGREATVLGRMVDEKVLTRGQADKALAQPLTLKNMRANEEVAPHLVEQIRIYLEKKYGPDKVYKEGLTVRTTINYRQQLAATRALEDGLRALDKRQGYRGPLAHKDADEMENLQDDPPGQSSTFQAGEIFTATVLKTDKEKALVSARGAKGRIALKDMLWAAGKDGAKKTAADILHPGDVVEARVKSFDTKTKQVAFSLEQEPLAQGALVAIDPWEGKVKAEVGGFDFQKNEYNHALYARRQPGSAFKPFVYAAAMEAGFTPASTIDDGPVSYDDDKWKPANYDHEFYGPTRLREALVQSRNVVTVELLHQIGVQSVIELAQKLGMPGPFARDLTLGLGSCGVTPMELTAAYCSFANQGYRVKPYTISQITDARGNYLEGGTTEMEQVVSPITAYQITSILKDAVLRGTAKGASFLGLPVAGKTGTTNDYKDAWFVGYTQSLVAGVWVGYDDHKTLGHGEAGARAALPVWTRFMGSAGGGSAEDDFAVPEGIEFVDVDSETGLLPGAQTREVVKECFKAGTAPEEHSPAKAKEPAVQEKQEKPSASKAVKHLPEESD